MWDTDDPRVRLGYLVNCWKPQCVTLMTQGQTRVLLIHLVSDLRWLLKKVKERHFFFAAKTWSYIHKLKLSVQWSPFPGFAGGTTDEDSYPSSGSESRESSAGSIRSLNPIMPQHPPPSTPQLLRDARRRATKRNVLSSLVVDIPQTGELGTGPNSARSSGVGVMLLAATFGLTPFVAASVPGPGSPSFSCTDRERAPVLFMHWQREDTCPFHALIERGQLSFSCIVRERTHVLYMHW